MSPTPEPSGKPSTGPTDVEPTKAPTPKPSKAPTKAPVTASPTGSCQDVDGWFDRWVMGWCLYMQLIVLNLRVLLFVKLFRLFIHADVCFVCLLSTFLYLSVITMVVVGIRLSNAVQITEIVALMVAI